MAAKKTKERAAFILSMNRASQNLSCIMRMRQCKKRDGKGGEEEEEEEGEEGTSSGFYVDIMNNDNQGKFGMKGTGLYCTKLEGPVATNNSGAV